jgi:hypothetical protein
MKTLYKYIFYPMLFCSLAFISVDDIITAIKNGDATELSKYFDNTVQITLPEKSNSYSKSQGELVLRDFFVTNGIKDFEVLHKGDNAGSQFCIGSLQTKNGVFRTTIFLKLKGEKQVLQEIRFEK